MAHTAIAVTQSTAIAITAARDDVPVAGGVVRRGCETIGRIELPSCGRLTQNWLLRRGF